MNRHLLIGRHRPKATKSEGGMWVMILLLIPLYGNAHSSDVRPPDDGATMKHLSNMTLVHPHATGDRITNLALVTGRVTDANGEPLPGVSIIVKGTSIGTTTDAEGNYSIDVPPDGSILIFSFIGYQTQEVSISGRTVVDVSMVDDVTRLDEVVVIGYGEQSREKVTTAISKMDNEVLENVPYGNVASAMQGTLPGVRVQSTSGQPGATPRVVIRGGTSINNPNGAQPLYVVDGVIRPDIANIAPEDIESFQVLKDAASTAIYGARGSNGVVVITTRSGKPGKAVVTYSTDISVSEVGRTYDLASARDYLRMARLAMIPPAKFPSLANNLTGASGFGTGNDLTNNTAYTTQYLTAENEHKLNEGWESMPDPIDPSRTLIFKGTDWQDVLFRTAMTQNHHLSISGGSENATFNAGLGYLNSEGVAITTDLERLTFNFNGDFKMSERLRFFGRVLYARSTDHQVPNITNIFARAATLPPTTKYRFEDGTLAPGQAISEANPEYILTNRRGENADENLTLTIGSHWDILPGFSFDPQVSVFNRTDDSYVFQPAYLNGPTNLVDSRQASASHTKRRQTQADAVFTYDKTIMVDHTLNAKAGFSYFSRNQSSLSASGQGASTDLIPTLNASAEPTGVNSSITDQVILGYFARLNYDYKYKYLVSLSMRYDGASNLGADYRWGFFPGISVGWNLHHEDFWNALPEDLLTLKLRASYGVNGNISGLNDFTAQGAYSVGARYGGMSAIQNTVIPNPNLKWEESKTLDIGADVGLFGNRVSLMLDYYRRVTDNLITNFALPPSTGFGSILTNLGSLENKGFEVEIGVQVLPSTSDFQWNVAFNAAKVSNKILKLPDNGTENNRVGGYFVWNEKLQDYSWQGGLQEGGTMGDLYAYKQESIFTTDEEALNAPVDMIMTVADRTKYGGDVNWADRDGNGIIDSRDQTFVGNIYPDWTGGLTNSFRYKNFTLLARLDFTTGHTIYNYARAFMHGKWKLNMNLTQEMVENSWKEQGDVTYLTRYYWNGDRGQQNLIRGNSQYYESGDFLAIREVTLSYSLPTALVNRLRLSSIRLNVTGNNLHYFTAYKGLNPEEGDRDYGRYPIPRNLIFGLNVSF